MHIFLLVILLAWIPVIFAEAITLALTWRRTSQPIRESVYLGITVPASACLTRESKFTLAGATQKINLIVSLAGAIYFSSVPFFSVC